MLNSKLLSLSLLGLFSLSACSGASTYNGLASAADSQHIMQIDKDADEVVIPLIIQKDGNDYYASFKPQNKQGTINYELSSSLNGKIIRKIQVVDEHTAYITLSGTLLDKTQTRGEIFANPEAFEDYANTLVCDIYIGNNTEIVLK